MDVQGDIVFDGDVHVNGGLVMQQDAAIKAKNIVPVENGTLAQVGGDLYIDLAKTMFDDSATPHIHLDTPTRFQINGDQSAGSRDTHAENVNSTWYVKTKYLEATTRAINIQIGVSSDLAILNCKKI